MSSNANTATVKTGLKAFGLAAAVAVGIVAYGQGLYQPLVMANIGFHPEIPWAAPTMAVLLAGLLAYLSGRGWPKGDHRTSMLFAGLTCLTIMAYTLFDGFGVRHSQSSLGYITSSTPATDDGGWVGLALLGGGAGRIGGQLLATSPIHDAQLPVAIVSAHMLDPENSRVRA